MVRLIFYDSQNTSIRVPVNVFDVLPIFLGVVSVKRSIRCDALPSRLRVFHLHRKKELTRINRGQSLD